MARHSSAEFRYPRSKRLLHQWYLKQHEYMMREFMQALPDVEPRRTLDNIVDPDYLEYDLQNLSRVRVVSRDGLKSGRTKTYGRAYRFGPVRGIYVPPSELPIFPGTGRRCDVGALVSAENVFIHAAYLRGDHQPPFEPRIKQRPPVFEVVTQEALALSEDRRQVIGRVTQVVGANTVRAALLAQHEAYQDAQPSQYIDLDNEYIERFGRPR